MEKINRHNRSTFDSYAEFTIKYKDDFRAGGHTFLSWKMRRSLLGYMSRLLTYSELDILDIGCNNGIMGRELCNSLNARNVTTNIDGIDFVEEATKIAKADFNYRSTFVADITNQQRISSIIGEKRYQLAFCCEVFLYINPDDYKKFFTTIHSLLEPHGHFLFLIPNVRSVYHLINKAIAPKRFGHYYKYDYDLRIVRALLQEFGFSIVSIYGSELLSSFKINLNKYNEIKNLFSFEIAILAKK